MTQKGENHDTTPKRNQIRTGGGSDAERFHAPPPDVLSFYHNALFCVLDRYAIVSFRCDRSYWI